MSTRTRGIPDLENACVSHISMWQLQSFIRPAKVSNIILDENSY